MKSSSSWVCPACGIKVDVDVDVRVPEASRNSGSAALVISVPETALADVFAHAWSHTTSTDGDD